MQDKSTLEDAIILSGADMKNRNRRRARRSKAAEELGRISASVEKSFFDAMRRPPKEGDRMFYWSFCYSDSEFKDMTIKLMLHAKIPQHLIYIFDTTGFMVNERGYKRLSKEEKEEIKQANAQYAALEEEGKEEVYKLSDYEDFESTDDPLVNALYVCSVILLKETLIRASIRWTIRGSCART